MSQWNDNNEDEVCSDEEIENMRMAEDEEMDISEVLHEYFAWQEIYGVHLFLESRNKMTPSLYRTQALVGSRLNEFLSTQRSDQTKAFSSTFSQKKQKKRDN